MRSGETRTIGSLPWDLEWLTKGVLFLISDDKEGLLYAKNPRFPFDNYVDLASFPVNNSKKYVCNCGKVYSQKSSLDRHLKYECGKMPNVPCPQCGKMFKHKHHVTQHLKSCWQPATGRSIADTATTTADGGATFYRCNVCGKSYSWKSSYHRHLREECGKQQKAKCKNCGRQYRWRDSLNKHLKYECGVEPKYACSVCGRKFRHKQNRRGTTIALITMLLSPVTSAGNGTRGPIR
ncbi:uncharacterized protein LOC143265793 [Megachile rotundata]|uniref:uncharacterized protein LOC143265793 n=1 Tax=Megachile rotundata TaxID=143995 RepID=UPI003FCF523B